MSIQGRQEYPGCLVGNPSYRRLRRGLPPAPVESATHHSGVPPLHFELHSIEGNLQEMDGAVVGVDDELAIGPLGVFVSADQKFQSELFEDVIVSGVEFVIG